MRINSGIRYVLRQVANNFLPWCLRLTSPKTSNVDIPVVVSLTSFPARIGKVWMTIESILRQNVKVEKVILWLSRDQFPGEINDLPKKLMAQTNHGLEIRFVDGDIRSHKKYYYVFLEFPDKYILTIDDDLLFPSTFVKDAYECAGKHPGSVIAHFGSIFEWNKEIGYLEKLFVRVKPELTGRNLFFGSGGGTLFPPNVILPFLDDIKTILSLCPTADDIYLNALIRIAGCEVTFRNIFPLLSLTNKEDEKLHDQNGYLFSPNSVNAVQLRSVVQYYNKKYDINPFDMKPKTGIRSLG